GFFSSYTSGTSLPTPTTNMNNLALLDLVRKNKGVTTTPPRTMANRSKKKDEGRGKHLGYRGFPHLFVAPVESTNSLDSTIHVLDTLVVIFTLETTRQ
ncbi:hypothetical protein J1N35_022181, partial [Gossypium stocksii]